MNRSIIEAEAMARHLGERSPRDILIKRANANRFARMDEDWKRELELEAACQG